MKLPWRTLIFVGLLLVLRLQDSAAQVPATAPGVTLGGARYTFAIFSADGKSILTNCPGSRVGDRDNTGAFLWDAQTGEFIRKFGEPTLATNRAVFSPDGKWVALACGEFEEIWPPFDPSVRIADAATGKEFQLINGHNVVQQVDFSPDGKQLLSTAGGTEPAMIWNPSTGEKLFECGTHVYQAMFSLDGRTLLTRESGYIAVWNASTGKLQCELGDKLNQGYAEFSPDGKSVLTTGPTSMRLWDAQTGKLRQAFEGQTAFINVAHFSPDGFVYTANDDKMVRFWDCDTGKETRKFENSGAVKNAVLSADGKRLLAVWSVDEIRDPFVGGVSLWDVETGKEIRRLTTNQRNDFAWWEPQVFSPDGKFILVRMVGATLLWDSENGKTVREYK